MKYKTQKIVMAWKRQDSKVARASASLASFSTYDIKFALEEQF